MDPKPPIDFDRDIALLKQRWQAELATEGGGDADMVEMSIRYLSVLRFLYRDPDTTIFWAPVDLNLYRDYLKYVREPMDLGTIRYHMHPPPSLTTTPLLSLHHPPSHPTPSSFPPHPPSLPTLHHPSSLPTLHHPPSLPTLPSCTLVLLTNYILLHDIPPLTWYPNLTITLTPP